MERPLNDRERRRYPRVFIDLPLEYRDRVGSCLRGGIVVNASKTGFLIESTRDLPLGTELNVVVLFSKAFKLAAFKAMTKILWKEPYQKEDLKGNPYWEGYQYGLKLIQILDEDRWKMNWLLGGRYELEETFPSLSCQH